MRTPWDDEPVDIYWNLHKHVYSVRARVGADAGRVIMHTHAFGVRDARFVVNPRGREKVLVTGRKNVHAFVRGFWQDEEPEGERIQVRYNPRETGTYTTKEGGHPVYGAEFVVGTTDGRHPILIAKSLDFSLRKW